MKQILKKAQQLVFQGSATRPLTLLKKKNRPLHALTERELIQLESEIGRTVFGDTPAHVVRREFFNLDEKTWIWHEEIVENGTRRELTTKYEICPQGILKVQPNYTYSMLEGEELHNFIVAVKEYYERVARTVYRRDPSTGKRISR